MNTFYAALALMTMSVLFYLVQHEMTLENSTPQSSQTAENISEEFFENMPRSAPMQTQSSAIDRGAIDQNPRPQGFTRQQMQRLLQSTVYIQGDGVIGSGFFISEDGYILSNRHVTEKMSDPEIILVSGKKLRARKISQSDEVDLSLLKVSGNGYSFLPMGDASQLYPAQQIITIGNPSGLSFTVTRGIVSNVSRNLKGVHYIQTDAAINPGNSGGPMITEAFEVVGVNTLTAKVEKGISFALPINYAYQSGGIAEGIGVTPPSSPAFKSSQDPLAQASRQQQETQKFPEPEVDIRHYQKEVQSVLNERTRKQKMYAERIENLRAEITNLVSEAERNRANISAQKRYNKKAKDKGKRLLGILSDWHREYERSFDQMISIIERAKGDGISASRRAGLDAEIQKIREQKQKVVRKNTADYDEIKENLGL